MWQYVITGIIVAVAMGVAIYKIVRYFADPLRKCRNCEQDCHGCPLEELKERRDLGT